MITEESTDSFMIGSITVSPQHNTMSKDETSCRIQPKVMAVLQYLADNNDRVINNEELLEQVWQGRIVTNASIQKSVNALRAAFSELDDNFDYVVYFSKRGYQLLSPIQEPKSNSSAKQDKKQLQEVATDANVDSTVVIPHWKKLTFPSTIIALIILSIILYLNTIETASQGDSSQTIYPAYTQVKPYISNTGYETLIEPHATSNRVALIKEVFDAAQSTKQSLLLIQGNNGHTWQASIAKGSFVALAWSPSGRNLVVVDHHNGNTTSSTINHQNKPAEYYSFHIYTLDFKAEKVIEKNMLSHWHGAVASVTWWDESTLEFTASMGDKYQRTRYRYGIADQNLSEISPPTTEGKLLISQTLNKKTAILNSITHGEQVQFFDKKQQLISQWPVSFKIISMSWMPEGEGVLLLLRNNQLRLLDLNGQLHPINLSPAVRGRIIQAKAKDEGRDIILTVKGDSPTNKDLKADTNNNSMSYSSERFMEKGGGFIYSVPPNN